MDVSRTDLFKLSPSFSIAYSDENTKVDLIDMITTNLIKLEGFAAGVFQVYYKSKDVSHFSKLFNDYGLSQEEGRKEILKVCKFLINEKILITKL